MLPWAGLSLPLLIPGFADCWCLWLPFRLNIFHCFDISKVVWEDEEGRIGGIPYKRPGFASLTSCDPDSYHPTCLSCKSNPYRSNSSLALPLLTWGLPFSTHHNIESINEPKSVTCSGSTVWRTIYASEVVQDSSRNSWPVWQELSTVKMMCPASREIPAAMGGLGVRPEKLQ